MFNPRSSEYQNRNKRIIAPISLDDLVEENDTPNSYNSQRHTNSNNNGENDNNEDDELEAYMATIENESSNQIKKVKLNDRNKANYSKSDDDNDDPDDELSRVVAEEPRVEDIKADVEAAIAGANAPANKMTKKLNQLSTRTITYTPFKKDFYQENPELASMTKEEVEELRLSLENIKVVGKSCPKPVTCWAHCGLSKKVMEVLKKSNYLSPTPIQAQAIPAIMSGRDVIGIAKTGCGKTLSFLLPMFRHILAQPRLERGDGPIAVIITPTRELATQICDDALKFAKVLALRVVAVYGGPNISEQIGLLKPGAEIVVCTPGRMIEILTVNSGRVTNMNRCTFLVLDEADRLFDMGFEKQIRSIVDLIRPDRQTVMFSATFPKILEAHARKILTDPVAIQVGGRSVVCKDVHQTVEIIEEDDKFLRLLPILQKHVDAEFSAIVFVSKQDKADSLLGDLIQAYDRNCLVLHGGMDKHDRMSTFASFKGGKEKVLVATSVAARGLDVKNCICVVNYDCPNHYEDYVHRCGRTGRAGNKGFAYTFITPDQGHHAADIIKALELSGNPVPDDMRKLWHDYKTEAENLGKKVWTSSGFSGRGFKFDEAEAQLVNEKKKYQKKSLGMQNSSDEEDDAAGGETEDNSQIDTATLESEIRNLTGSRRDISKPIVKVMGGSKQRSLVANETKGGVAQSGAAATLAASQKAAGIINQQPQLQQPPPIKTEAMTKLELVRQRASMLCKKKGLESVSSSASQILANATTPHQIDPSTAATDPSIVINSRSSDLLKANHDHHHHPYHHPALVGASAGVAATLAIGGGGGELPIIVPGVGGLPVSAPQSSSSAPTTTLGKERIEMQVEINDYHQQVRRRLTSKETLAKISEHCEVGITVRGQYCPPGDRPNEPKLYLAIEATAQVNAEKAHRELLLVVKDEYNRINSQPATRGRFRIV